MVVWGYPISRSLVDGASRNEKIIPFVDEVIKREKEHQVIMTRSNCFVFHKSPLPCSRSYLRALEVSGMKQHVDI